MSTTISLDFIESTIRKYLSGDWIDETFYIMEIDYLISCILDNELPSGFYDYLNYIFPMIQSVTRQRECEDPIKEEHEYSEEDNEFEEFDLDPYEEDSEFKEYYSDHEEDSEFKEYYSDHEEEEENYSDYEEEEEDYSLIDVPQISMESFFVPPPTMGYYPSPPQVNMRSCIISPPTMGYYPPPQVNMGYYPSQINIEHSQSIGGNYIPFFDDIRRKNSRRYR